MNLLDRVSEDGISISADYQGTMDHDEFRRGPWEHDHWKCVLVFGSRKLDTPFKLGMGFGGAAPTVEQVLECLLSDASGIANGESFEEFCDEYGYDNDSRTAEKIYLSTIEQTTRLKAFLGDKFDEYMWETE